MPPFVRLPLSAELDFKDVPPAPGVAEFLGADERSLLVGRPQNLQRFVKNHLGRGPAPKKGARPPLDLSAIALLVRYATTGSLFEQRLLFERTLTVPREKRPDLKDAYFVALDPEERFPRFRIAHGDPAQEGLFGPLRGRAQAEGAIESLTARFPLRPCDYVFEPREDLALGLGCLFAQTRTCPAPCLVRIGEGDYREIARGAVRLLEDPRLRDEGAPLPSFVGRSLGSAGLVVIPKERVSLYPVAGWSVLGERACFVPPEKVREAVGSLSFEAPLSGPDDSSWLTEWLYARKREGAYVPILPGMSLADEAERIVREAGFGASETMVT